MTEAQATQLGRIVRTARLKKGWSLAYLMEHVGIDQAWLNRLELGRYADPRLLPLSAINTHGIARPHSC